MTFGSFFRSIGQSISHAAVGIYHAAGTAIDKISGAGKYIIDRGVSLVTTVSHDASTTIGTVAHEASGAVKGVASSLALPLAVGIAAIGGIFLLKQR
jgi:hypothetical protein